MRGKIVFALFILTIVAVVVSVRSTDWAAHKTPAPMPTEPVANPPLSTPLPADTKAPEEKREPQSNTAPVPVADPKFQEWVAEEAKSLDDVSVNGDDKEAKIKAAVAKITPAQTQTLKQTVNAPSAPPREKILSAYLLVEGGENTRQALKDSITAPLKEQGEHEVHSEGEINGVREKSLRIMMIDGLVAQAKNDPRAKQTLAQAIADSDDAYIKAYAQKKFDELSR